MPVKDQVTVPPLLMPTLPGLNELSATETFAAVAVGGGPAFSVKSCVTEPAAVALTAWGEVVPTLSTVVATPLGFVVLCAGLRPPPPVVMVQVTTMPGTAQLFASRAVTPRDVGSGLLKYQVCRPRSSPTGSPARACM